MSSKTPHTPTRTARDAMADQNDQSAEEQEMDIAQFIFSQLEAEDEAAPPTPSAEDAAHPPGMAPRWDKSPTVSVVRARKERAARAAQPVDGRLPETSILRKARVPKQVQELLEERQQQRISTARAEGAEELPPKRTGPPTRPNAVVAANSRPTRAQERVVHLSEPTLSALKEALASLRELSGYRACLLVAASSGVPLLAELRAEPPLTEAESTTLHMLAQRYAATFEALFPSQVLLDRSSAPSELFVSFGDETHMVRRLDEHHIICMLVLEGAELNVGLARYKLNELAAAALQA